MSTLPDTIFKSRLLPVGWHKAPLTYWRIDPKDALIFLLLNLLLGTCGLSFPVIYASLGPGESSQVLSDLFAGGAAYLFVIPFLASVTYTVFEALEHAQEGGTRKQYHVYVAILVVLCITGSFLISTQFAVDDGSPWPRRMVQGTIFVLATLVGTYIFCLLRIDSSQSMADDIDKGAQTLTTDAQDAKSDRGDFD